MKKVFVKPLLWKLPMVGAVSILAGSSEEPVKPSGASTETLATKTFDWD